VDSISQYISTFPAETQVSLNEIREFIHLIIPEAEELLSYGIPTFKYYNNLVHFAGYKHHVGFYPGADSIAHFKNEFSDYKSAKGSVQFPLNKSIPFQLIERVVRYRVAKNNEKLLKNAKYSICINLHVHLKKVICPICGENDILNEDDFSMFSKPTQRALVNNGIHTWTQLSLVEASTIINWHGIGLSAMPKFYEELDKRGLKFQ
jgi:uncharacterized protein YdhG (YjbR/CyaY superfamily)